MGSFRFARIVSCALWALSCGGSPPPLPSTGPAESATLSSSSEKDARRACKEGLHVAIAHVLVQNRSPAPDDPALARSVGDSIRGGLSGADVVAAPGETDADAVRSIAGAHRRGASIMANVELSVVGDELVLVESLALWTYPRRELLGSVETRARTAGQAGDGSTWRSLARAATHALMGQLLESVAGPKLCDVPPR